MRMRQSLAEFERAFHEEAAESVVRRERLRKEAAQRSRERRYQRREKQGKMRFILLTAAIVATTVLVTIAMFQTLTLIAG